MRSAAIFRRDRQSLLQCARALLLALCACSADAARAQAEPPAAVDDEEQRAERIGDGDPAAGQAKSQPCQGCHGADGNGTGPAPKLAGQYAAYIGKQMLKFKFGERTHTGVDASASNLDSDSLADIAAYFASQDRHSSGASASATGNAQALVAAGDAARAIPPCASCHGAAGQGAAIGSDSNPALGGQHAAYLRQQLQDWRSGKRSGSSAMVLTAKALTDAEIDALSTYLSALD